MMNLWVIKASLIFDQIINYYSVKYDYIYELI